MLLGIVLRGFDRVANVHAIEETAVAHLALLRIERLLGNVAALDDRHYRQAELLRECIVAAVVGRNGHDRARAIAGEHILADPDRHLLARERVDAIGAREHARDRLGLGDALTLGLLADLLHIGGHRFLLRGGGQLIHQLAFGRQHHESHAEDGVHPRREDSHRQFAAVADRVEHDLRALGFADPVALHLLQGVCPCKGVQALEQTAGIGRHAQLPLLHLLLLHRETAAHAESVLDFVVCQDSSKAFAPVHGSLAQIGYAPAHEDVRLLLFGCRGPLLGGDIFIAGGLKFRDEFFDRTGLVLSRIEPAAEHLEEGPLRPLVILRIAGFHFARPVVAEADTVQLLAVARYVLHSGDFRVLTRLDRILLGGKAEGVVAHRVKHIEAFQTLVAGKDVACDVSQRMPDMQARTRRVREHVQHVELGLVAFFRDLIRPLGAPSFLPFALYLLKIVIHY